MYSITLNHFIVLCIIYYIESYMLCRSNYIKKKTKLIVLLNKIDWFLVWKLNMFVYWELLCVFVKKMLTLKYNLIIIHHWKFVYWLFIYYIICQFYWFIYTYTNIYLYVYYCTGWIVNWLAYCTLFRFNTYTDTQHNLDNIIYCQNFAADGRCDFRLKIKMVKCPSSCH